MSVLATISNQSPMPIDVTFNLPERVWHPLDPGESWEIELDPVAMAGEIQFFCRIDGLEFGYLTDFIDDATIGTVDIDILGLTDRNNLRYQHLSQLF